MPVRVWVSIAAIVAAAPPAAAPVVPPELVADLAALAAARQATVPAPHRPVLGGPTTLTFVSATGPQLTLVYEVEIDVQDYRLPADPTELFPAFEARFCPGAAPRVCYVFTDRFPAAACADPELRPLLERGAIVHYLFRDLNQRPLTDISVAVGQCPG